MQYNLRLFSLAGTSASMIEPKRVLRALAEHWTLLEPLCERFDAGTLSLVELRHQLAAQLPAGTPTDITALLDQWIRLDILVPVAKSPNRFELNAQIHDFLAYLRRSTASACAWRSRPTCAISSAWPGISSMPSRFAMATTWPASCACSTCAYAMY